MSSLPKNLRIGVLRGGPSDQYDMSLDSGSSILKNLSDTHKPIDIFISQDGTWHLFGIPKSPDKILMQVDVIFNALRGNYGEDGKVQHILNTHGVPFTGSDTLSSAMSINKVFSKDFYKKHNIKTPQYTSIKIGDDIKTKAVEVFKNFLMPVIVKPASSGSSIGISMASSIPQIMTAISVALEFGDIAIIEEYIKGTEASCGVIEDFRGEKVYALMPVEIQHKNNFLDFDSKHFDKNTNWVCPGHFSEKDKKTLEQYAKDAHLALGLKHYSVSDFIVSPRRGVFILETNTLPSLAEKSPILSSLEAIGMSVKDFIHHSLDLALHKKG